MRSKIIVFAFILLSAFALYKYIYKSHPNTLEQELVFEGTVDEFTAFVVDRQLENKYMMIKGLTSMQRAKSLSIENLTFHFNDTINVAIDYAYVQCRYLGYDELLEEYSFDQCVIINK